MSRISFFRRAIPRLLAVGMLFVTAHSAVAGSITDNPDGTCTIISDMKLPDFVVTDNSGDYYDYRSVRPYDVMEKIDFFEIEDEMILPGPNGGICAYALRMSSKQTSLEYPDNHHAAHMAMWDDPYQRIVERSMPWIEFTNTSTADTMITQIMMTIGDEDFHFSDKGLGPFIMESTVDSPGLPLTASVTELDGSAASNDASQDKLTIDIGDGGLAPGETIRFRITIKSDDPNGYPFPDYRLVLFDMNGLFDGDSADDNSVITVTKIAACPVPEPSSIVLLSVFMLLTGALWRRRG